MFDLKRENSTNKDAHDIQREMDELMVNAAFCIYGLEGTCARHCSPKLCPPETYQCVFAVHLTVPANTATRNRMNSILSTCAKHNITPWEIYSTQVSDDSTNGKLLIYNLIFLTDRVITDNDECAMIHSYLTGIWNIKTIDECPDDCARLSLSIHKAERLYTSKVIDSLNNVDELIRKVVYEHE